MKQVLALVLLLFLLSELKAQSIEWQKCFGGSANDWATISLQTKDGGYLFGGGTSSADGDAIGSTGHINSGWIVKLDSARNIVWKKFMDSCGIMDAIQTSDNGFLLIKYSFSKQLLPGEHGDGDVWLMKLSLSGETEWEKFYGGSRSDGATTVLETSDSCFVFSGFTQSIDGDLLGIHDSITTDPWLVK